MAECHSGLETVGRQEVLESTIVSYLHVHSVFRFYGRFCVGSIDHISIRQLQLILLKVSPRALHVSLTVPLKIALILGLRFEPNVTFQELCPEVFHRHQEDCHPPGGNYLPLVLL